MLNWWKRAPSVDGWVLPQMPAEVFAAGKEMPVPMLLGSNLQEIVVEKQTTEQTRRAMEEKLGRERADRLQAVYARPGGDPTLGNAATRWMTDWNLRCPAVQIAEWHAGHGWPTYVYQFDRPLPGNAAAMHSTELHYVFRAFAEQKETAADDVVSDLLQGYWTAFARSGDPNVASAAVRWPRFRGGSDGEYLHVGLGSVTPEVRRGPGGDGCQEIMPAYLAATE